MFVEQVVLHVFCAMFGTFAIPLCVVPVHVAPGKEPMLPGCI